VFAPNHKLRPAVKAVREPGPNRKILTHLGEPLKPPPLAPARGPPFSTAVNSPNTKHRSETPHDAGGIR
jgi:hypothetical protein